MRLALLSDVHANLHALQACLDHARGQAVTAHAFLGDLVGYGAYPAEVVERVRRLVADGAIALRGNHDEMAVRGVADSATSGGAGAQWTRDRLDAQERAFLAALPLQAQVDGALLVHASADQPEAWQYADHPVRAARSVQAAARQGARLVLCGHVHAQHLFYAGRNGAMIGYTPSAGVPVPLPAHRQWLATVGSVGQPRDGDPRAMYAVWDAAPPRLTFHRVAYACAAAADAIRAAGLPASFADRLLEGR